MCLTPITLKTTYRPMESRYTDGARRVPCGKCPQCLKRRQNQWSFRLNEEKKRSTSVSFLTFTYETPPLTSCGLQTLEKTHWQLFMKKLRKNVKNHQLKYYMCGEYGTNTQRPHYHAIMFNLPQSYLQNSHKLHSTWEHGHIYIAQANLATMHYVIGYLQKGNIVSESIDYTTGEITTDPRQREFSLMSKKLGLSYITPQMAKYHTNRLQSYVTGQGGQKMSMPRYFRDKIFTKEEKNLMNEDAELQRDQQFTKLFNDNYNTETQWKKDQIRKHEKNNRLTRIKI